MKDKESIVVKVDESTKGIMQEIESGITTPITQLESHIKQAKDDTEEILLKMRKFDGLSSSLDNLRKVSEDARHLSEKVSPIGDNLLNSANGIHESIRKLSDKESDDIKHLKDDIETLASLLDENRKEGEKIVAKLRDDIYQDTAHQLEDIRGQIQLIQAENNARYESISESMEKLQVTLDIVVNLVTPFWKRWSK